jgi:hypothetical protein
VVIFVGNIEHAELNNQFGSGEEIKGLGVGGCNKLSEGSKFNVKVWNKPAHHQTQANHRAPM